MEAVVNEACGKEDLALRVEVAVVARFEVEAGEEEGTVEAEAEELDLFS